VTILTLDAIRDRHLRAAGWPDPFRHVKGAESAAAVGFYPRLVAELDSRDDDTRLDELIAGIFAGNIFDLGALATVRQYEQEGLDFFATRGRLPRRPWLDDCFDAMAGAWSADRWCYRKVIFLVDNAGTDFVLGCLPLAREMAGRRKAEVVIGVNSGPSLNDILADEVQEVFAALRPQDPLLDRVLREGGLRLIETGNTAPLIDLGEVSDALNAEAAEADLLILEGMGRSVESNRDARFKVDTAKMALLKDPEVARRIGGKLFDVVCRFEQASLQ
jgi:type II pantothenate kinase